MDAPIEPRPLGRRPEALREAPGRPLRGRRPRVPQIAIKSHGACTCMQRNVSQLQARGPWSHHPAGSARAPRSGAPESRISRWRAASSPATRGWSQSMCEWNTSHLQPAACRPAGPGLSPVRPRDATAAILSRAHDHACNAHRYVHACLDVSATPARRWAHNETDRPN